ncbi:BrnA antitoxin family protein [Paralcaligenes ureilyticus]|uniref:BrnA antitoxin of type II toxin-antitoxin system n=1 Tax=Paralcaligenes ureilyticus TaxID=627131 RepID=A0A4R3M803_9BURK|nr:BrnA antitoxin family protein [Paralcaligenes ureilyticus]TCT09490.1 BrnA antitoxin of type II toxin-antitoxin system [Paralcaligenes ureilyticus]
MSSKRKLIMPTQAEDAAINAGIAADPDTYELSQAEFKQLKRVGRPRSESPKVALTVRYDADIIEAFKSGGEGWQTRMNHALRDWLRTHRA